MQGGEISGNTARLGGGVYVDGGTSAPRSGTFIMEGGEISGNTAASGGGVYVYSSIYAIFHIVTGIIYGSNEAVTSLRNTATSGGGGIV
jgi:hypothetical protein